MKTPDTTQEDMSFVDLAEGKLAQAPAVHVENEQQRDARFTVAPISEPVSTDVIKAEQIKADLQQAPTGLEVVTSLENPVTMEAASELKAVTPEFVDLQNLADKYYVHPGTRFSTLNELQQSTAHSLESSKGLLGMGVPLVTAGGLLAFLEIATVGGVAGIVPGLTALATSGLGGGALLTAGGAITAVGAALAPVAAVIGGGLMIRHFYKAWKGKRAVDTVAKKVSSGEMVMA